VNMPFETTAERVARQLRADIASGVRAMGSAIVQDDVAAQLRVSRMPVREALRQLENEGLIRVVPNAGAFVSALDAGEIREVYEMRTLLECDLLRRALPLMTASQLAHARELLDEMAVEHDGDRLRVLNDVFHTALYAPAARVLQQGMIEKLRNQTVHFYHLVSDPDSYRARAHREHLKIWSACKAGDAPRACDALAQHLRNSADAAVASREAFAHAPAAHTRARAGATRT
jgi:DNA-binding GntR family transcriptional regulator